MTSLISRNPFEETHGLDGKTKDDESEVPHLENVVEEVVTEEEEW